MRVSCHQNMVEAMTGSRSTLLSTNPWANESMRSLGVTKTLPFHVVGEKAMFR